MGSICSFRLCGAACVAIVLAALAAAADVQVKDTTHAKIEPSDAPRRIQPAPGTRAPAVHPPARNGHVPRTRWEGQRGHILWNRAALSALKGHGAPLVDLVPRDIDTWCPAYAQQDANGRRHFWVGFLSALARHESTYRAEAVGGGGRWYGLLQILPATARAYGCRAGSGEALKNGPANLSCALRIMARTVPRDGVISGKSGRWQGVSADWGPMRSPAKRRDIARWVSRQPYCRSPGDIRPRVRPR